MTVYGIRATMPCVLIVQDMDQGKDVQLDGEHYELTMDQAREMAYAVENEGGSASFGPDRHGVTITAFRALAEAWVGFDRIGQGDYGASLSLDACAELVKALREDPVPAPRLCYAEVKGGERCRRSTSTRATR